MAEVPNKDRVRWALEDVLAKVLEPYIDQTLAGRLAPGSAWTDILTAKYAGLTFETYDIAAQLKIISEPWGARKNLFWDVLSKVVTKSYASELLDARNKVNHGKPFTVDEAARVLDTVELLLKEIGAPRQADDVRKQKRDLLTGQIAAAERKDRRAVEAMPSLGADDLPGWRMVLEPHPDVAAGDFVSAEFAADLYQVANGESSRDYADPIEFFQRTYLTDGLQTLLKHVARRVGGDKNAEPIINLQTTFGGGKTHSMLAAWHLFAGQPLADYPQTVQDVLAGVVAELPTGVRRVAIVGNELSPGQTWTKADGTVIHTIWGELAWQLGGAEGYALVAEADKNASNPGAALRDLFAKFGPALILIDEWVAYARGLVDRTGLPGGEFGVQRDFAQALNAAVKGTPGIALLVSIPASEARAETTAKAGDDDSEVAAFDIEIGGEPGHKALEMLDHTVTRDGFRWSPASSVESFEIVKRRLFRTPDAETLGTIGQVARRFSKFYLDSRGELPSETRDGSYEKRIEDAYPIHPEFFDRLYGDWSSLPRFQRTRGVLRLMSAVVHELYASGDDSPLIMPGSIPLDSPAVRDELTGYLDDAWKAIIEKDIDGPIAASVYIDKERPLFGTRALARRIARATFLGSAATVGSVTAAGKRQKGIERKQMFLGVAMPGDTIGNFGSALSLLGERATYLYEDADRYWYDQQPSLNRLVAERAENYSIADVHAEIVKRLRQEPGHTAEIADVVIAPDTSRDVPESERARLVVAGPAFAHLGSKSAGGVSAAQTFAQEVTTKVGAGQRINANTVVVLAPDKDRLADLDTAVRQHLAWRDVYAQSETYNLTDTQKKDAQRRIDQTNAAIKQRILETWTWLLHAIQKDGAVPLSIDVTNIRAASDSVVRHASEWMRKNDVVGVQTSPALIAIALTNHLRAKWNEGRISVGDLWEYTVRYPYMARLKDKGVLLDGIRAVVGDPIAGATAFALATGYDAGTGDFEGLYVPGDGSGAPTLIDTTLLVKPDLATAQRDREKAVAVGTGASAADPSDATATTAAGGGAAVVNPPKNVPKQNVDYRAVIDLKPQGDLSAQLKQLAEEILVVLQSAGPDSFEVRIEVDASKADGFDTGTVRTVKENGNVLGFGGKFIDR